MAEEKYVRTSPGQNRMIPKGVEDWAMSLPASDGPGAGMQDIGMLAALLATSGFGIPGAFGMYGRRPDRTEPTRAGRELDQSDARRMALRAMRSQKKK